MSDAWGLALRIVLVATAVVLGVWLLVTLSSLVLLLVFAVTLAAGLGPIVAKLQRIGLPRGLAVLLLYLCLILAVTLLVLVLVPQVVRGTSSFIELAPAYLDRFITWLDGIGQVIPFLASPGLAQTPVRDAISSLGGQMGTLFPQALRLGGVALGLIDGLVAVVALLATTFYLLVDGMRIREYALSFLPPEHRPRARAAADEMGRRMGGWVLGQLALSTIIGLASFVGLLALGIPGASVLAVIAAIGEIVPMVGPILSVIPALIVAALLSPFHFAAVLVLYIVIQQLENHLLVPNVMGHALKLQPLAVVLPIIAGSALAGVAGALVAVPLTAATAVALDLVRQEDREEPVAPSSPLAGEGRGEGSSPT